MRYFLDRARIGLRFAMPLLSLTALCATAIAQTPEPIPDVQKEGQLTTKPQEAPPSQLKPVPMLFDPKKEMTSTKPSLYRKPFRLSAGIYSPNSDRLRRATNSVYAAFNLSMDLPPFGVTQPFTPEMYIDGAYHRDRSEDTEATVAGQGVAFRYYPHTKPGFTTDRPRPYYGAGVGAYYLEYDIDGKKHEGTSLGAKAMAGFDFPLNWSLEVNYTLLGKLNGHDFGGPMVMFSYRL